MRDEVENPCRPSFGRQTAKNAADTDIGGKIEKN